MEQTDSLVARAKGGDLDAFRQLAQRYAHMAYGYAYSILGDLQLAEDASQEALIEVYHQLQNLRHIRAFPTWFRRIVYKHCDRLTRRKHLPTVPLDAMHQIAASAPGPEMLTERREIQEKVMAAIRTLPEHHRTVTVLFYIKGYSQDEIGAFLDVPVTTVKKRLHDSRKKLKERMGDMVKETPRIFRLPEDFVKQVIAFPFPRLEPPVEIADGPEDDLEVHCLDTQCYFLPLVKEGKCDWTFYDWPGGRLTGVYECNVIGAARWKSATLLRSWTRFTDLKKKGRQEWFEGWLLVERNTWRRVHVDRGEDAEILVSEHPRPGHPQDPPYEPIPMNLKAGTKWGGFQGGEVVGVSRVTIGDRSWRCLKVVTGAQHYKSPDGDPAVYAEWYVAESGRTVFFRRYNGPGYSKPGGPTSFESLAGNLEAQFRGITFRHFYDCVPDIAIEGTAGRQRLPGR